MKRSQIKFMVFAVVTAGLTIAYAIDANLFEGNAPSKTSNFANTPAIVVSKRTPIETGDAQDSQSPNFNSNSDSQKGEMVEVIAEEPAEERSDGSDHRGTETTTDTQTQVETPHSEGETVATEEVADEDTTQIVPEESQTQESIEAEGKNRSSSSSSSNGETETQVEPASQAVTQVEGSQEDKSLDVMVTAQEIELIDDLQEQEAAYSELFEYVLLEEPDRLNDPELGFMMLEKYIADQDYRMANETYSLMIQYGSIAGDEDNGCLRAKIEQLNATGIERLLYRKKCGLSH